MVHIRLVVETFILVSVCSVFQYTAKLHENSNREKLCNLYEGCPIRLAILLTA